jgi:hypothetical protein
MKLDLGTTKKKEALTNTLDEFESKMTTVDYKNIINILSLTCICLTVRLFRVTLEISRTACKSRAPSVTLTSHRGH